VSHPLSHWSYGPLVLLLALATWHAIGLRRMPAQTSTSRWRPAWFYGGLLVLIVALASPLDWWGYRYFYLHTVQHLLLMFAGPTMIVAGAPWRPLLAALPGGGAGRVGAVLATGPVRALGRLLTHPAVVLAAFNLAMVGWVIPGALDLSLRNRFVHVWLANGSMLLAGVLFWLLVIDSPPLRVRPGLAVQAGLLLGTNVIMWGLAMSMSLFATHSWYSVYAHVPGVGLSPYGDQLLGAGILWVCGDFWAVPALVIVVRRLIAREQGDADAAIDRILGQGSAPRTGASPSA